MPPSSDSELDRELRSTLDAYGRDLLRKARKRRRRYADLELELEQHRQESAQLARLADRLDAAISMTWAMRDIVRKALSRAGEIPSEQDQDERPETT